MLSCGMAHAGNEDEVFVGSGAALVGGAVVATVRDSSAVWYNPAGIGESKRTNLDVSTNVYSLRLFNTKTFLQTASGDESSLAVAEFVAVPVQVSFIRPLSDSVALGLGYFQPRAARLIVNTQLDSTDGALSSNLAVQAISEYSETAIGGALGFVPSPGWRVGIGTLVRWDSLTESIDISATTFEDGAPRQIIDIGNLRTRDVLGIEPIAGVQWDATEHLQLGVNVRGPRLSLFDQGKDTSRVAAAANVAGEPVLAAEVINEDPGASTVRWVRLGRYYAGGAYRWNALLISVEGDLQPGHVDKKTGAERNLVWNARVGCSYDVSKIATLGLGLFTDRAATDTQEATLVSKGANFLGASVGLQLTNEHLLAASERYEHVVFSSVFALRYAHANAQTSAVLLDASQPDPGLTLRTVDTTLSVHELAFYLGSGFHF